ncbi:hypothetical protein [Gelidibacter salicanalis]|uniref:Uncharacterized protein n=1 Tax=Gelidibacter salicanalis TaxID=291193 RepID=A0A934KJ87_9FLAO|nr:hypothetical protein [Gelidibacter salicanalis]MBJ7880042.1 hypothetical protein [Gelidibacter salicanalis]
MYTCLKAFRSLTSLLSIVVNVLNSVPLKNKKIVMDGTYMLLNEADGGGHSH